MVARVIGTAMAVLALGAPAWAGDADNLRIFREVQAQVLRYPHFTIFDSVNARIDDGVLTLTGKVTMPYKRQDIERRVRGLYGVKEVHNRIDVLPVSQFDDQLRLRIARAIYRNPAFLPFASMANPPIHVIVERGHVTLEGVVNSEVEKAVARSIASGFPAFSVTNALKTNAEAQRELEAL